MSPKAMTPNDFLAANNINHQETEQGWQLEAAGRRLFLPSDLSYIAMSCGDSDWKMSTAKAPLRVIHDGKDIDVFFASASRSAKWEEFGAVGGYKLVFNQFVQEGTAFDIIVQLFIGLNYQTGDLSLNVTILENGMDRVGECRWPGGFNSECVDRTIMPFRQGIIIPKNWPQEINGHGDCIDYTTGYYLANTRMMYMQWWGFEKKEAAVMMIVDTPDDFGFTFHHPAGGPTEMETRFLPSMGKFRYPRKLIFKLFEKGNYVSMAHAYREYLEERGRFVSLKEKIARNPVVEKMLGSAILHCGLLYEWKEDTECYKKHKELTHSSVIVDQLKKLYDNGLRDAYLHLDGWGYQGYDSLEPDSIPIGSEAGGEEGVLNIERQCHSQGYLFALHQQFRDNYLNAASFCEDHLFQRPDGTYQIDFFWCGGKDGLICSTFSPEYTRRNNRYFSSIGLKMDGSYLDVFSVAPLDECNNPDHPVSRTECKNYRAECFGYIRHTQGVVSSEEAVDWTMPYIDLVHHAPWAIDEKDLAYGISIPLFSLVYHDSLLIPWFAKKDTKGGTYLPIDHYSFLCALINAGIPYIDMKATAEDIAYMEPLRALQKRCALQKMINHEFLSDDCLEERSTFEDGTTVTVNHHDGTWSIK